jgi:glyoxylase-like metal-dependent hydrolase (beta-lactamase superfamily II)
MKKIHDGIFFIKGQDDFIPDSHVYLLGDPTTHDLSLIDAGLMGKGDHKIQSIKSARFDLSDIKRVIMTHTHFDHISCIFELLEHIPHAELWIHVHEAATIENGEEKIVYGMDLLENMCKAQFGLAKGVFSLKINRKLEDGENLELGGMTWRVMHIPGHSPGSIGLYCEKEKILIPGDVVYADYAIGRFDLEGSDGRQHRDSLFTLGGLDVDILLPGHNRIMERVPHGYILETARQWEPYLT